MTPRPQPADDQFMTADEFQEYEVTFISEASVLWAIRVSYDRWLDNGELSSVRVDLGRVVGWVCKPSPNPDEMSMATPLVRQVRFLDQLPITEGVASEWRNERYREAVLSEDEDGETTVTVESTVRVIVTEHGVDEGGIRGLVQKIERDPLKYAP